MIYLVCYDITDDAIRLRVARVLEEYGDRVQRSVFEVDLRSEAALNRLVVQLTEAAQDETDIRLYRLCKRCREVSQTLNGERVGVFPAVIIV